MADQADGQIRPLHDPKDREISRLNDLVLYWKDTAGFFIDKYCEQSKLNLFEAWLEYEDHLDGQGRGDFR